LMITENKEIVTRIKFDTRKKFLYNSLIHYILL